MILGKPSNGIAKGLLITDFDSEVEKAFKRILRNREVITNIVFHEHDDLESGFSFSGNYLIRGVYDSEIHLLKQ